MIRRVLRDFLQWERPIRFTLILALVLLGLDILVLAIAPETVRPPALIGGFGLLVVIQLTVMYAYRDMATSMNLAQRRYMSEDYTGVVELIEPLAQTGKADMRMLTLLGNAYRQLGRLDESKAVLYEALNKSPDQHYPLYGIGRTLLSEGDYAAAAEMLDRALASGAPPAVQLDRAEAYFRAGDKVTACDALEELDLRLLEGEAPRELMATYLREQLGQIDTLNPTLVQAGLPYWEAAALRFEATPYGRDLAKDVQQMRGVEGQ